MKKVYIIETFSFPVWLILDANCELEISERTMCHYRPRFAGLFVKQFHRTYYSPPYFAMNYLQALFKYIFLRIYTREQLRIINYTKHYRYYSA